MAEIIESFTAGDDSFSTLAETSYSAQTFTLGTTGTNDTIDISSVEFYITAETGGTGIMTAEIFETDAGGFPVGSAISSGTFDMSLIADDLLSWISVDMTTATLKASTKYALVFRVSTVGTGEWDWRKDTANGYAGGSQFTTADTGVTWTEVGANDMLFSINGGDYAGTLCTLAEAINKAGANVSALAVGEALVSNWVRQAEGIISSNTRFDWVDNYASISEDVRFILNRTASAMAAIDIIAYDMSGYTTETAEAETMINIYREEIKEGLALLERQDVKSFLVEDT